MIASNQFIVGTRFCFNDTETDSELIMEIPNNINQDPSIASDKTFDNGIVSVRFCKFFDMIIDKTRGVIVEA